MPKVNNINHIAVVVSDIDASLHFWQDALGIHLHEVKEVPAEASKVAFLPVAGAEIELVAKNIRLINEEPRQTNDGRKYAFIHPESTGGVLVELYEL